jgi:hypothetical protein
MVDANLTASNAQQSNDGVAQSFYNIVVSNYIVDTASKTAFYQGMCVYYIPYCASYPSYSNEGPCSSVCASVQSNCSSSVNAIFTVESTRLAMDTASFQHCLELL